jgi:hypothetical protein
MESIGTTALAAAQQDGGTKRKEGYIGFVFLSLL